MACLHFDALGAHALSHEAFEIGIDRPVLRGNGIEARACGWSAGRSPLCSGNTPREQLDERPPPRGCRSGSDLSRVVKIPVLRCTASQDIKAKPPVSLRHKGPFHQSSRRLSTVQPRRATLRHPQCPPCYLVQPKVSSAAS